MPATTRGEILAFAKTTTQARFPAYYAEIEGMVDVFQSLGHNVTLDAMVAWNWIAEIKHMNLSHATALLPNPRACTSLIARNANDGTILHARNDDADPSKMTSNLTVDVDFVDVVDGKRAVVAKATAFLGWAGVYTSLRAGVASLTEDHRISAQVARADYMAMVRAHKGMGPTHLIMRQAMVDYGGGSGGGGPVPTPRTFDGILAYLQATDVATPEYMILAGTNDGAVIARNYTAKMMGTRTLRLGATTQWVPFDWALIQTNYNFWEPLPYPQADPRRQVLVKAFQDMGQSGAATVDGLLGALSIETPTKKASGVPNGVLNAGTVFSVILVPSNATLRSYLRESDACCG